MNTSVVIRDWTKETLVVDLENSLGEKYHFGIPPGANPNSIPSRSSNSPLDKASNSVFVQALFLLPVQLEMFE